MHLLPLRPMARRVEDCSRHNIVGRCVGWLKAARREAAQCEMLAVRSLGRLELEVTRGYLRTCSQNRA